MRRCLNLLRVICYGISTCFTSFVVHGLSERASLGYLSGKYCFQKLGVARAYVVTIARESRVAPPEKKSNHEC